MTKDRFDRLIDGAPSADKIDAVTRSLLSFRRFNEQILGQNLIAADSLDATRQSVPSFIISASRNTRIEPFPRLKSFHAIPLINFDLSFSTSFPIFLSPCIVIRELSFNDQTQTKIRASYKTDL